MDNFDMDIINTLRSIVTLLAFTSFIGIIVWAWSGARRTQFADAANIPLEEDGGHLEAGSQASPRVERSGK